MKKIYVTKPYLPNKKKYEELTNEIWESQILTNNGPLNQRLINKFNNLFNCKNINTFCNGHQALEIALKSLEMKKGGEIITTPFTFVSTTHAIVNCGFKPVFCDIKMSDYTIDEEKIEALINENTVAILGVHVYGFPCNVDKIQEIANKHNLKVIYDAAHAFGVTYKDKSLLTYGDVSIVSFHATKIFNTIEGGMSVSKDQKAYEMQKKLQNFGIENYKYDYIGTNAKMNEFEAAMGLATIDDLEMIIKKRKALVELYKKELENINGIITSEYNNINIKSNYAYFPIVVLKEYGYNRDELADILEKNGIYPRKYFYPLTSDLECYKYDYKYFADYNLEIARKISDSVLTLPLYYDLDEQTVKEIVDIIRRKK